MNNKYSVQKFELLFLNDKFQKEVLKFRKKWKIPLNGFELSEQCKEWYSQYYKSIDDYDEDKNIKTKYKDLFKARKDALQSEQFDLVENVKNEIKELDNNNPVNSFNIDIANMLSIFSIPLKYKNKIMGHILEGNSEGFELSARIVAPDFKKKEKIYIEITADTTLREVQELWSMVQMFQKQLIGYSSGRKKPSKQFERDKRIFELHTQGIKNNEIKKIINNEYTERIIGYDEIAIIISRFKKKIDNT